MSIKRKLLDLSDKHNDLFNFLYAVFVVALIFVFILHFSTKVPYEKDLGACPSKVDSPEIDRKVVGYFMDQDDNRPIYCVYHSIETTKLIQHPKRLDKFVVVDQTVWTLDGRCSRDREVAREICYLDLEKAK